MGKDLKGRNLGRGLSQRPDGRYMGRVQVNGKPILQNCVEAAIANGLMTINPVIGVIVPKCEKVECRLLSVEEQKIFLE